MEVDVFYLKCILCLIFCIYQGLSLDLECRSVDSKGSETSSVDMCYNPLGFQKMKQEETNCALFSCSKNDSLTWKVIDSRVGKIEFQFNSLPKTCNYMKYSVELEVYDSEDLFNETLSCVTSNGPWKTHSKRITWNRYCTDCNKESQNCLEVHAVTFKYVYPGWYRIKVTPYVQDGSTRRSQRSYRIFVNDSVTNYVKKRLVDLSVNVSLQYRDSPKRELDVTFLFGPDLEFLKLDGSEVVMKLVAQVDPTIGDDACYETGREQACCAFQGGSGNSTNIKCEVRSKVSRPVCRVSSGLIDCTFNNVAQGNYCVIVRFEDDRCTKGTIWADQFHDPCRWDIRKEFSAQLVNTDSVVNSSPAEILYVAIALVILLALVLVLLYIRRKRTRRRRMLNNAENAVVATTITTQHFTFNNGHVNSNSSRFSFGQLLTLTERPRPEVLLVYSRESTPFMELVACLRKVLDKICKCQVYDYFDPELWNDVSQDPQGWVHALIVERKAKIVIIASEVAAIRHKSLMGEVPERSYKTPHPFDHLFLYALKLLRDGMDEDSYKNHFVVTFDGYTENNHLLEYFNPYMRFVLPKHLNKLFEHLHDTDTTVHFDTSRRLEERYEVRQLRLRLEHLINLKLLSQSDVETQKLYDW